MGQNQRSPLPVPPPTGPSGNEAERPQKESVPMSEKHPECPLYNPLNCKEYHNPKLCAFARKDRVCRKKIKSTARNSDKT